MANEEWQNVLSARKGLGKAGLQEIRETSRRQENSGYWTRLEWWGLTRFTEGADTSGVTQSIAYK